jgi:hypothetical protein
MLELGDGNMDRACLMFIFRLPQGGVRLILNVRSRRIHRVGQRSEFYILPILSCPGSRPSHGTQTAIVRYRSAVPCH